MAATEPQIRDLTVLYVASPFYLPYLKLSLATLPPGVKVLVGWYAATPAPSLGGERPGEIEVIPLPPRIDNFHKSFCLNRLAERVATTWLMIADADMLFPSSFAAALSLEDERTVTRFFVARFTREFSERVRARQGEWEDCSAEMYTGKWVLPPPLARLRRFLPGRLLTRPLNFEEIYASPNPAVYSKSLFDALRGYDERYLGYGYEDVDLYERGLARGARERRLPVIIGHLYHPRVTDFPNYVKGSTADIVRRKAA